MSPVRSCKSSCAACWRVRDDAREAMATMGLLCAFALLATPPSSSREVAESKFVEFFNGTLSVPKPSALVSKAKGCLGTPPCSAHGKCHESKAATSGGPSAFSCKCEAGYIGKDCAHTRSKPSPLWSGCQHGPKRLIGRGWPTLGAA